jgi:hypothetical protein
MRVLVIAALATVAIAQSQTSSADGAEVTLDVTIQMPAEVTGCAARGSDGVFCSGGTTSWKITSSNAEKYEGQSLKNCGINNSNAMAM